MFITGQEELQRECDRLIELLETEKRHVTDFLRGDVQEEYCRLLEMEIQKVRRIRKRITL